MTFLVKLKKFALKKGTCTFLKAACRILISNYF